MRYVIAAIALLASEPAWAAAHQQMTFGLPSMVMVDESAVIQQMAPGVMTNQEATSPSPPAGAGGGFIGGGFFFAGGGSVSCSNKLDLTQTCNDILFFTVGR